MAGQKNSRSGKDKMMAAYMKERGITRTTGQCPLNPRHSFPVEKIAQHFLTCKGTLAERDYKVIQMNLRK